MDHSFERSPEHGSGIYSVFVVDDHHLMRMGLRNAIENEPGLSFAGEADGANDALSAVKIANPNVVVVDLILADGTGLDLIRDLRVRAASARIVVHTAADASGYPERCIRAGAHGFVSKTDPAVSLIQAIRRVAEGHHCLGDPRTEAILERLAAGAKDPLRLPTESLSASEFQVFHLIGQGLSNTDIAHRLHRSTKTIETYRSRIKKKMGALNSTHLAQLAVSTPAQKGRVRPEPSSVD